MKPNIVFDMGQVLMEFAPMKFITRLGYTGEDAEALTRKRCCRRCSRAGSGWPSIGGT